MRLDQNTRRRLGFFGSIGRLYQSGSDIRVAAIFAGIAKLIHVYQPILDDVGCPVRSRAPSLVETNAEYRAGIVIRTNLNRTRVDREHAVLPDLDEAAVGRSRDIVAYRYVPIGAVIARAHLPEIPPDSHHPIGPFIEIAIDCAQIEAGLQSGRKPPTRTD